MKIYFTILISFFITACSFETPPNEWQYKSATAFHNYTDNFLSGEDLLAKYNLQRAVKYAKRSADLRTLARVYLGKCALNLTVGIEDSCVEYQKVASLIDDEDTEKYFYFLTKQLGDADKEALVQKEKATSLLLDGALRKDKLDDAQRKKLLEIASYHGYKKVVLFWLHESLQHTSDKSRVDKIQKKIDILER